MDNLKNVKHIHFVGIKGVGMAPLAIYAKEAKISVSGSDIEVEFITDEILKEKGISWTIGFDPKDLPQKAGLAIATGAHGGMDNSQAVEAKKRGLPVWMQGEAIGKFMEGKTGVSVVGSHGKTTTTGMLATLLARAGLDPSYVAGCGSMRPLGAAGHKGKGEYFVTEADEYANEPVHDKTPKFLYQHPKMIIATNIDYDHPDMFASIEEVEQSFLRFLQSLPKDGIAIINGDDSRLKNTASQMLAKVITFGIGPENDFVLTRVGTIPAKTTFFVKYKNVDLGEFIVSIPGRHNCLNALAVIAAGLELGLSIEVIREHLSIFEGGKRRFELMGTMGSGATLYDDYAHHPKEIAATLAAVRQWFPKTRITVIFQPHTYSRTRVLFNEFTHAFLDADAIVLTDIYASLREEKDGSVSMEKMAREMSKFGKHAVFVGAKENVVEYIKEKSLTEKDIVITMGAGDIYKISEKLKVKS